MENLTKSATGNVAGHVTDWSRVITANWTKSKVIITELGRKHCLPSQSRKGPRRVAFLCLMNANRELISITVETTNEIGLTDKRSLNWHGCKELGRPHSSKTRKNG